MTQIFRLHNHHTLLHSSTLFLLAWSACVLRNNPRGEEKSNGEEDKKEGKDKGKKRLDNRQDIHDFITRKEFGEGFNL